MQVNRRLTAGKLAATDVIELPDLREKVVQAAPRRRAALSRLRYSELMEHQVLEWITQYSYVAIFSLLVLGIVGLPVPDETLLTFTGYMVYKGHLVLALAFLSGFLGSACGITLSYVLGRTFGIRLIHRYGKYLHIKEEHLTKAHAWFGHAGHWSLTFGYFIPGVRHFTAYAAGMSELKAATFMLFAYSGAALWVATFIGLGYFLGERWEAVLANIHGYFLGFTIAGVVLGAGYLAWRKWGRRIGVN